LAIEEGARVRQKAPTIEGTVVDTEYDKGTKELRHLVEYDDADGETQTRWFTASDLEEVDDA
jgi:hypothetical protein